MSEDYGGRGVSLTSGGQKEDGWHHDDPPYTVPDDVETVCNETVADNSHGDVDGVLRHKRWVAQCIVVEGSATGLATFHYESLYRSHYIYS